MNVVTAILSLRMMIGWSPDGVPAPTNPANHDCYPIYEKQLHLHIQATMGMVYDRFARAEPESGLTQDELVSFLEQVV